MKVALTGANGHVGANLIRELLKNGHEVRVLQFHDHKALDGQNIEIFIGDLLDKESLVQFCSGIEVVYHLAAKISIGHNSYEALYETNVEGTKNVLHAARSAGVKKFIHFSSIHAFVHNPTDEPMDESRPRATHSNMPYEKTKSLAEEWVLEQQAPDFDVIALNPSAILGPLDYKPSLLGQFLFKLNKGKLPGIVPGGYNFVDVRDICIAANNAMQQGRGGEKYILSGHFKTVSQMADLMREVTGKKIPVRMLPLWLAYAGVPFISLWSRLSGQDPLFTKQSLDILQEGNRHIVNDKARKELGFDPRPLSVSIKDTLDWFEENKTINQ